MTAGRLRLLHFAQEGDTSGYFPQLARWHDRERYEVRFGTLNPIAPSLRARMEGLGVSCFSCDAATRGSYPLALLRLTAHLRSQRIDILHTHLFEPSVVGLVAGALAAVPLRVMTRHYSDYHTRIRKVWHVRLDQLCTRLAHLVLANSQHTADHMVQAEGAPKSKVVAIPLGIDFDRVQPPTADATASVRRELGLAGIHAILIAARLHPEKGYETLFAALPLLQARLDRPVQLLIAGTGAMEQHYRALVQRAGLERSVRFLGFRADLPVLMKAADIFVLPSTAEAFGLVLAEALYLGVPVVASRVGGIPEIVEDGGDGLLVPPGDPPALAEALARVLQDSSLRARLAGAGRAKIVERFDFRRMVRAYERAYEGRSGS